jgi:hypothetical protein
VPAVANRERIRDELHISAYVPPQLKRDLEVSARLNDRSLSGELRVALAHYLKRRLSQGVTTRAETGGVL